MNNIVFCSCFIGTCNQLSRSTTTVANNKFIIRTSKLDFNPQVSIMPPARITGSPDLIMKIASIICITVLITLSCNAQKAKAKQKEAVKNPTWTDAATATKEHTQFKWIGEYKDADGKHFHQVTLLKDGKYLVTSYQTGLPGRGWKKTTAATSKIFSQKELEKLLLKSEKIQFKSPTMAKKTPKEATLVMPSGFTNIKGGLLLAGGKTTKDVGSFKMHLEFMLPFKPDRNPSNQDKGNSGIYIYNNYEIQVLDTFALDYSSKEHPIKLESKMTQWCGCLYKMKMADTNMGLPPLVWQTYDIEFIAPEFDGDKKIKNAIVTVVHNGIKIHDKVELKTGTGAGAKRPQLARGPILFQNHGNPTVYRNVWIVETD
jgi:hypothetical protein